MPHNPAMNRSTEPSIPNLPFAAQLAKLPYAAQGIAVATGFWLLHGVLDGHSRYFFYLPVGLSFALLLMLPLRLWPWLLASEWLTRLLIEIEHNGFMFPWALMAVIPQPVGAFVGAWWVRRQPSAPEMDTSAGMARVLAGMALAAAWAAAAGIALVWFVPHYWLELSISHGLFGIGLFLGNVTGMLLIAPTVLAGYPLRSPVPLRLLFDLAIGLALPLLVLLYLRQANDDGFWIHFGRALSVAPPVYFALRYGWRGAAIAITLSGLVSMPLHIPERTPPDETVIAQLMLVVMASAALLLGSAMDALRANTQALRQRQIELERMGRSLRESAQRNLRLEEEQRRRLVAELHDELGQGITALHTRIKLMEPDVNANGRGEAVRALYGMLGNMRSTVRHLSDSLRPAVLDEFGLLRALGDGPLRDLLDQSGITFGFTQRGESALVDALEADTQLAVWRIAQEAVTNTVRHAQASRFDLKLRIGLRNDEAWLLLDLRDDGKGIDPSSASHGFGLQGMRDRALALSGAMRVSDARPGTRVHILLRQLLPGGMSVPLPEAGDWPAE